jgi:diaminopimelate decarboxylase
VRERAIPVTVGMMPGADLVATYGSPLWLINLDVLRDRWRTLSDTWRSVWPNVEIAYAHAANRDPSILRALAAEGAGHCVTSQPEYEVARSLLNGEGARIVVGGAGLSEELLARAASDRALVVVDSASQLRTVTEAGVSRLGLRVRAAGVGQSPAFYGVAQADVAGLVRAARPAGIEALAFHLTTSGFAHPVAQVRQIIGELVVSWPHPAERYATAARTLASLAVRLGVPTVNVGGGFPPAPDEAIYARAIGGALGAVGFDGRVIVEPGRAVVGEAVDLLCTVVAVKQLADGTPCAVVDASLELVPGVLWRWPHVDLAGGREGPTQRTAIIGSRTRSHDVLHPAATLPALGEGDVIVLRRVGAYNQSECTQHAGAQARVAVWDEGEWSAPVTPPR